MKKKSTCQNIYLRTGVICVAHDNFSIMKKLTCSFIIIYYVMLYFFSRLFMIWTLVFLFGHYPFEMILAQILVMMSCDLHGVSVRNHRLVILVLCASSPNGVQRRNKDYTSLGGMSLHPVRGSWCILHMLK